MEIELTDRRSNPLLKRSEVQFAVNHASKPTPTRAEVRAALAQTLNVPSDRIVIERMAAKFGTARTVGEAMVYETKDVALEVVREHILLRNGLKTKAAKPGSESAAAAPAPSADAAPPSPPAKAPASGA